jgi:hypothetical protein
MTDILYIEPSFFSAGDTVTWKKTVSDYPPADGWTLTYKIRSATAVYTVVCTTSGTDYLATILAAASAVMVAGVYSWVAYVTKTGEQHTIATGTVTILPDITVSSVVDARTDARIIYDSLIVAYKAYISSSGNWKSFTINNKAVTFNSADEIIKQMEYWRIIVQREEDLAKIANGSSNPRRPLTRFRRP